jgi:hypothetical protein
MGSAHAVEGSRSGDARLTLAVAGACVAAFGVFVTLLLVAVVCLGYFSPWGSTVVSWWLE